jgi:hypothetical protein
MIHQPFISRAFRIGACAAAIVCCAAPGRSQDKPSKKDKRACAAAYKGGQERQQAGHLREAREQFSACKKATCSKAVRQPCTTRYNDLGADIPSVVPLVTDEQGSPRVDVQVTMDGELLTTRLDGQALPVDPGMHEFSFSTVDSGVFATQRIVVAQGQRNRSINVLMSDKRGAKKSLAASTAPTPPIDRSALEPRPPSESSDRGPRRNLMSSEPRSDEAAAEMSGPESSSKGGGPGVLPYVVGGAGLLAIGTGALFIAWGNDDNDKLSQCAPFCSQGSVDRVSSLYTTANVSIGVGVAALGVATYLFLTSGPSKEKPPTQAAYSVDVQSTPSGAFATVSGVF